MKPTRSSSGSCMELSGTTNSGNCSAGSAFSCPPPRRDMTDRANAAKRPAMFRVSPFGVNSASTTGKISAGSASSMDAESAPSPHCCRNSSTGSGSRRIVCSGGNAGGGTATGAAPCASGEEVNTDLTKARRRPSTLVVCSFGVKPVNTRCSASGLSPWSICNESSVKPQCWQNWSTGSTSCEHVATTDRIKARRRPAGFSVSPFGRNSCNTLACSSGVSS
mmetsp:Transcript_27462/g.53666  ORF Transcript_27462/g.53666 Transcript_27462/m.53666 type:complete len:221 (-) Transcript_27462:395-1057(-)